MGWWRRFLTRLVAADPGMRRFRAAVQVIVAVVLAIGVTLPVLTALHQPLVAVAPAAVVGMVSMLAVRSGGREGVITTLLLPLAATVSFTLAALVHGSIRIAELVFLVVMFVAVWMRRFGPRWFAAGMAAFIGYFLALFLQASFATLPAMAGAAFVGAGAALLARFVLLPERPEKAWHSGVRALRARVHTLLHAVDALGDEPGSTAKRRRVHDELLRLNATALSLGTTFTALDALPAERADELRRHVLDVELAAGGLVTAVDGLIDEPVDAAVRPAVAQVTAALDRDVAEAVTVSRDVADRLDGAGSPSIGMAVRRLAAAAADLGAATQAMQHDVDIPEEPPSDDDEPEPPADEPEEPEETRRLLPTTRTAVQVVVAGALSIYIGGLVAPGQWFWAVITAFVVFAGANSRGELLVRAWSRTVGTLAGVVAGVVVASVVTGHVAAQGAVVLLCVFLAFYLLPLSYGLMTFFVTTMLGVLYGLLGRFSVAFLEIRLLETAIGAVAGAVAALIVLPTHTRGRIAEQAEAFLTPVAELLRAAADDLRSGADVRPLAAEARDVDTQMHALLLSARPLGSYRFGDARARYERWRLLVSSCATATRGFARVIGPTAVTCDADTRIRLGDLAATVADLADALAVRDPDAAATSVRRACEQEGTLVDLVEAVEAGPTVLRTAIHQLGRLRGVLADLSAEFGPRSTTTLAPEVPPARH
ncbi:FUSC family protein [Pseudonocardia charpentierae]|uniref:FUSC family protein n=1 Tax=Pseudonocardia charpentierae TaxID=3075545 RepID=A0ABU2N4U1_9PSEU|nr:FUSC family protein [Pseudonocardia sp. DSM 45834]MDT0348937.1 FUSC family protein [Pseudonocardia sp. DSM 45834]